MRHVSDLLSLGHDVKSMMDMIQQSVRQLEKDCHGWSPFMDQISNAADACTAFCNQAMEKYAPHNGAAQFAEVYLSDVMQEVADELAPLYEDTVEIEMHCNPGWSERLSRTRLRQLLSGLLKNAADATIANGSTGPVSVMVHRRGGDLKFDIKDTGAGLNERTVRQFAERAGEVAARGIGQRDTSLPALFAIAAEMGGRLALQKSGPEGTSFRLSLPSTKPMEDVPIICPI